MARPQASELGLNLGSYATGTVIVGEELGVRQGIFAGFKNDGTAVLRGQMGTYICDPDLAVVPDKNLITFGPQDRERLRRTRISLSLRATAAAQKAQSEGRTPDDRLTFIEPKPRKTTPYWRPNSADPKFAAYEFGGSDLSDDGY